MDFLPNGFEELCKEEQILVFFERLLNGWRQEVGGMTELEKQTTRGKATIATFNQCARNLDPLFELCRNKVLPDDIREALLDIVGCCLKRDYVAAMEKYIRVSISKAPWPKGVAMVGIHAREKTHAGSVAHSMDDESTCRYLRSIRRLMTFCERHYPVLPRKLNRLPSKWNGTDLLVHFVRDWI